MGKWTMNLQRFSQMLDAYGGDPRRWSEDERAAALDFLQHSEQARVLQQQALRLDQLLAVLPEVSASATLEQRIFNSMQNPVSEPLPAWQIWLQEVWERYFGDSGWRVMAACGLPLLVGVAVGLSLPVHQNKQHYQQVAEETDESTQRINRLATESIELVEFVL